MELLPAFARMLSHVDLRALESSDDIAYAVDATWRIRYTNDAWHHGAADRGAPGLANAIGLPVLSVCSAQLRPFYRSLYQKAARQRAVVEHEYSCPTPTHQQYFRMQLRGLPGGGVLVTHHLIQRTPGTRSARKRQESSYRNQDGLIVQCAHCRLTRRADHSGWDWVPAFLSAAPDRTSHGICYPCFSLYFPDLSARRIRS